MKILACNGDNMSHLRAVHDTHINIHDGKGVRNFPYTCNNVKLPSDVQL